MTFILSIGSAPDVLSRRSSVLAEAGYAIVSVTDLQKAAEKIANEEFDVLLVCDSVAEEDCRQLVNMGRRHRPFMRVILLPDGSTDDDMRRLILDAVGERVSAQASSHAA